MRIGTAEIYRIVENMEGILDSLVIGVEEAGDICVILFVVADAGVKMDEALTQRIRTTIRAEATPRHVPDEIYGVQSIPKTLNGKKVELAVRDLFLGMPAADASALADADCLNEYRALCAERRERQKTQAGIQTDS